MSWSNKLTGNGRGRRRTPPRRAALASSRRPSLPLGSSGRSRRSAPPVRTLNMNPAASCASGSRGGGAAWRKSFLSFCQGSLSIRGLTCNLANTPHLWLPKPYFCRAPSSSSERSLCTSCSICQSKSSSSSSSSLPPAPSPPPVEAQSSRGQFSVSLAVNPVGRMRGRDSPALRSSISGFAERAPLGARRLVSIWSPSKCSPAVSFGTRRVTRPAGR